MLKFYLFVTMWASFQSFAGEIDCRNLPKTLYIKSIKTTPESSYNFQIKINGYQWARCDEGLGKYIVRQSLDLASATLKSPELSFTKNIDWLEFVNSKDQGFSLFAGGMSDPIDTRIWHTWYVIFNEGPQGTLRHEAVLPDYARRPGESYLVKIEEFDLIVER